MPFILYNFGVILLFYILTYYVCQDNKYFP
jgi:hypothetical protein